MSAINGPQASLLEYRPFPPPGGIATPAATATKSWSVGELESLFARGDFSPEVLLLLNQIKDANQQVADTLNRTNAMRRLTDAIRERINQLREVEAAIRKHASAGGKEHPSISAEELAKELNMDPARLVELLREREYGLNEQRLVSSDSPRGADGDFKSLGRNVSYAVAGQHTDEHGNHYDVYELKGTVEADTLAKRIENLQNDIQRVDGMREAESMRVQEQLQLKQRLVTLATNILQTEHKTLEAITNNTRA